MTTANIHATCIVCAEAGRAFAAPADAGVLLLGESGAGKSDLALRLIAMGAQLVADDRCEIFFDRVLCARAPRKIAGLMEIRGLGIATLPFVPSARVALVARATRTHTIARLPERRYYEPPPTLAVPEAARPPEIEIDTLAVSAPARILVAVAAFQICLWREEIPG